MKSIKNKKFTLKEKKKKQTKEEKAAEQDKNKKIENGVTLLNRGAIPVSKYDEKLNCGVMEDGTLFDMMQIETKDIYATDPQKIFMDQLLWDRLLKTYPGDLKEISFLFPTDSTPQQNYIDHVARRTENPVYREILATEKEMLMNIHRNYFDREFMLCFFAKNKTELDDNRISIKSTLMRTSPPLIKEVSAEKKKAIFYKLYNKNVNL